MKKLLLLITLTFTIFAYDLGSIPKVNFVEIPKGKPTMIEFGKTKCIWCAQMAPYLKSIKEEYPESSVYYINVEKDVLGAINNNIQAIPTRIFLDANGTEVGRVMGYIPKEMFLNYMNQYGVIEGNVTVEQ